jgi:hypothetical protein
MDRFTSMGISNDAREFLEAAQIVRSQKPVTFLPVYFLACQSIELSLKAYLRGSGYSDKQLKSIGHNLDKCIEAARAAGVEEHVSLSEADMAAIAVVNPFYQYKDFQYSMTGYKSFPHIDTLIALGDRVWQTLRSFCVEHREYHFGKPTAIV